MKTIFTFIFCLLSISSFAKSDSLSLNISIGGNYQHGNSNTSTISGSVNLLGFGSNHYWSFSPTWKYVVIDKSPSVSASSYQNEFYSVQSYNWESQKRIKWLVFSEAEHSQLKKIDVRFNLGGGASCNLIKSKSVEVYFSEAILPDIYQTIPIGVIGIKNRDNMSLRLSSRLKMTYKSKSGVSFSTIEMFQPSVWSNDFSGQEIMTKDNTNFRSTNQVDIPINKMISVGFTLDYTYQSYLEWINNQYIDKITKNKPSDLSPSDVTTTFYLKVKL
jgi:Protein of unknown function, DUF481